MGALHGKTGIDWVCEGMFGIYYNLRCNASQIQYGQHEMGYIIINIMKCMLK